jgi:hypothetical protein
MSFYNLSKSQNIKILNEKRLINTFTRWLPICIMFVLFYFSFFFSFFIHVFYSTCTLLADRRDKEYRISLYRWPNDTNLTKFTLFSLYTKKILKRRVQILISNGFGKNHYITK